MKNKILITTTILSIALAGVVSAASIWGTYKGNDIIRLTVGGSPVAVSDVPAINYQSRTMIPIYLLKQAGINYTWDQQNRTVDIIKQQPSQPVYMSEYERQSGRGAYIVSHIIKEIEAIHASVASVNIYAQQITDRNVTISQATVRSTAEGFEKNIEFIKSELDRFSLYLKNSDYTRILELYTSLNKSSMDLSEMCNLFIESDNFKSSDSTRSRKSFDNAVKLGSALHETADKLANEARDQFNTMINDVMQ